MNVRKLVKSLTVLGALAVSNLMVVAFGNPSAKPNVLIILADDLGYSDPRCFGGEIATPHLDRLAKEGTRLTHFHNGGMCVVSRAMMMTGQWWPRAVPQFSRMPLLPEKLKAAGYRNALIGKWHLDGHPLDRLGHGLWHGPSGALRPRHGC